MNMYIYVPEPNKEPPRSIGANLKCIASSNIFLRQIQSMLSFLYCTQYCNLNNYTKHPAMGNRKVAENIKRHL